MFSLVILKNTDNNSLHTAHPAYKDNTRINVVDLALYIPFGIKAFSQQNSKQTRLKHQKYS